MEPGANKGIQQTVPDLSSVMGFFALKFNRKFGMRMNTRQL
jgi:hypothetical protein